MAGKPTRIISDIHYGDRASRVRQLAQLQPLLAATDAVVFNGDTLDTRPSPRPQHTLACRADVHSFAKASDTPLTLLTGNHDPDVSCRHWLELADGEVLVLHGDVLFEDMVPWGRDSRMIRQRIAAELGNLDASERSRLGLEQRLAIWRRVAATVPQRHQAERNVLKYAFQFVVDTVWPPSRVARIMHAWRTEPIRATALARHHHPAARYVILGHTHRPAIRRIPGGPVVINTGSFCPPFGGYAVDVLPGRLRVRRITPRGAEFHPGDAVAEFPLANG